MGFEILSIQGLSQAAWPRTPGPDSTKPKSAEGGLRSSDPAGAKTPEEALTYIEQLYQAGRTDELGGLLRRSPVFREAWQILQQFSSTGSEAAGGPASSIPAAAPTTERSWLPAPLPNAGPKGQFQSPGQDLPASPVTATQRFSTEIPAARTYPVPARKPSCSLAAGRRVYETQARYYAREKANVPSISLRV